MKAPRQLIHHPTNAAFWQPRRSSAPVPTKKFTINRIRFVLLCVTLLALCSALAWGQSNDPCNSPTVGMGAGSVGSATGCGAIITVATVDGHGVATSFTVTVPNDGNGNPYDGHEDTLVGVQNNSGSNLTSLPLTSTSPIFGFDGDGPCTYNAYPWCSNSGFSGYEGPHNTFNITNAISGSVNFVMNVEDAGIPNHQSTWFALEGTPASLTTISQTQILGGAGTTTTYTYNTDTYKITPTDNTLQGASLTVTAFLIPQDSFPSFTINGNKETCVPYGDYSAALGTLTCVEFQAVCTTTTNQTCNSPYILATGYDLPPALSGGIGGPDFLVAHGVSCPLTSASTVVSIFKEYEASIKDPTTVGGSRGPSCFAATYTPGAPPITSGNYTGTAYVANAGSNSVSVINTSTNSVASTVNVGSRPLDIAVDARISSVYVVNSGSNSVSVINTSSNTVGATVGVGHTPVNIALTPDGSKAYVANAGSNSISVINTFTNTVTATVMVGGNPVDVAISPDGKTAYVANAGSNSVSVINTTTNTVSATVGVGFIPVNLAVTPDGTKVYVANSGSRSISVINTGTNTVVATVTVGSNPVNVSISPDGSTAYVANAGSNSVSLISTLTNSVVKTLVVGSNPVDLAISPDGTQVYVVNAGSNSVSVINVATQAVVSTVPVGSLPVNAGITAGNVYVADSHANAVSIISTSSNTVTATVPVGSNPVNIGVP